jgi:predicted nucleic acid-binding protein
MYLTDLSILPKVHALPTAEDMLNTIKLQERHQLSFWDAMIVTSAGKLGCCVLYSEDLNCPQVIAGVQVVNLFLRGDRL